MGFQIAGICILLLFYGIYVLKMAFQRGKGIRTNQIARGKKEGKLLAVEVLMLAATYGTVIVEAVSIFLNASAFPVWTRGIGAVFALIGTSVFGCSVYTMRDSWRAGIPETDRTELITNGIYRFSRNPAFLGFDVVYLGILFMFFNSTLLVFTIFAMLMLHLQILQEERFLPSVFGEAYLQYKKTVCRYLGRK